MTERNKQEQVKTEIPYQTLSEFLQSTPPNQWRYISDLSVLQQVGPYPSSGPVINKPKLVLHCPNDSCNGVRSFRCTEAFSSTGTYLQKNRRNYLYVTYQCSNCRITQKVYSLAATLDTTEQSQGICYKLGELPPYGPPVPSRLIKKNRILGEIVKVSEKIGVPQDKIDTLGQAIQETRFSKALKMAKDVMPESLLIDGHSPILLLYRALSRGVHELSDEECLERAGAVRCVLGELSERLSAILKDKAELTEAVSTLMHHKSS